MPRRFLVGAAGRGVLLRGSALDMEFYKQFVQNESFRRFVTDMVYNLTNE